MIMEVNTYRTKSGRHVGIRCGLGDVWITAYLDRDQHKGSRVRCNQIPTSDGPFRAQYELDKYAKAHGWEIAGVQEVDT